ncbi:hypothetical protein GWI33_022519 [Rhynchophorus ferrugineus]|uniref:Uncharacterized protein n=1 Tax=Rhynchophorus ferrugineus TaxID=354439 RepID=A0A834HP68_RHYFE|nr:hypothetical protein GWI33_022519 [Rhynchophorus ferrugineus]
MRRKAALTERDVADPLVMQMSIRASVIGQFFTSSFLARLPPNVNALPSGDARPIICRVLIIDCLISRPQRLFDDLDKSHKRSIRIESKKETGENILISRFLKRRIVNKQNKLRGITLGEILLADDGDTRRRRCPLKVAARRILL